MTELVQPLAAAPTEIAHEEHVPSFTEVVYAHYAWWKAMHTNGRAHDNAGYHRLRQRFEATHGPVVHAFWCSHVESAVALTLRPRAHAWSRRRLAFHRESDWATKDFPEVATELHRCDDLAVRAQTILTGVRQHICLQLVAASAAHLLSLVDRSAAHEDEKATAAALERERAVLDRTAEYYRHAANGQAQIAYFAGMATVAAVISIVAGLFLTVNWALSVAALIAGAVGAVVSVVQRINNGDFELEYDVGRPYAFFLGGLRPLIGGALALAISFAFTSGIAHLPVDTSASTTDHRYALLVVAFLAGFSERWAQDTLATAVPRTPKAEQPTKTTTTTTTGEGKQ